LLEGESFEAAGKLKQKRDDLVGERKETGGRGARSGRFMAGASGLSGAVNEPDEVQLILEGRQLLQLAQRVPAVDVSFPEF
jgi:hypothetical protein